MLSYFLSTFIGTFILEDVALASGIILAQQGKLSYPLAFLACFLGIGIGDIGVYGIGYVSSFFPIEKYFRFFKRYREKLEKFKNSSLLGYSIVISRAIPGTRLPTYLGAGYVKYSFSKFTLLTIFSVFLWVLLVFVAGRSLQSLFAEHWLIALIVFFVILHLLRSLIPIFVDYWQRRAFVHFWRRWLHFEFWPAWLFYIPIVPYYIYLSIKYRGLMTPFYANPNVVNGGLLGESKWDFLQHLKIDSLTTLRAVKIAGNADLPQVLELLKTANLDYPFILKPDVGQRGFGVRIIRNDTELSEYLSLSRFDLIAQRLSSFKNEAGLFYIRHPQQACGKIFSITDKQFPSVVGDGKTRLGDLILSDVRARIIAPTYFERFKEKLFDVPSQSEQIQISECGNHCQGAIFKNGNQLLTVELQNKVDAICKQLPDFYFGRLDVRYKDVVSLKNGEFEIIEFNGAGAEATHIWDTNTKLLEAYATLFVQWDILFSIGAELRKTKPFHRVSAFGFLKESYRVFFRKEPLSVSS